MENTRTDNEAGSFFRDICLQVGVWGVLVVGFLTVCVAVPMLALNI